MENERIVDVFFYPEDIAKVVLHKSGSVFIVPNSEKEIVKVHNTRHELVMDLVEAREQSLVGFNWRHEREALVALANKRKIPYAVIDGSVTKIADREEAVRAFQAGEIRVIFAHPQSAGHGLTLTKATATIWASPTYNAEHFTQFNRRIHRKGQTKKTETICICAKGTKEEDVYAALNEKVHRMEDLLNLFTNITQADHAA